mmetsp:Transcript_3963/g.5534  ORF Transcript_3963/g.5534 Transcript_3963/m.5534 type:complete len:205 (+) Transcript_3963:499-1113(+)
MMIRLGRGRIARAALEPLPAVEEIHYCCCSDAAGREVHRLPLQTQASGTTAETVVVVVVALVVVGVAAVVDVAAAAAVAASGVDATGAVVEDGGFAADRTAEADATDVAAGCLAEMATEQTGAVVVVVVLLLLLVAVVLVVSACHGCQRLSKVVQVLLPSLVGQIAVVLVDAVAGAVQDWLPCHDPSHVRALFRLDPLLVVAWC